MNQVSHHELPADFVARLVGQIDPRKQVPSEVVQAAQLVGGRWLANYRERLRLTVAQLAAQTDVDPQQIEWIEWGLADPRLLPDAVRDKLSWVLAEEDPDDIESINAVLTIALGQVQAPNPHVITWVLEDLMIVQPVPVASPMPERVLDLDEVLVLLSLAGGERPSYDIWQDVVMRRSAGDSWFDNAACLALLSRSLAEGLVEQAGERFDAVLGMKRLYFRLTALGRQVLVAQQKRVEYPGYRPNFMKILHDWLAGMGAVTTIFSS